MAGRLNTLFFVLVLSVSVFSGTTLQSGDMKMKEKVCSTKCCEKKVSKSNESKDVKAKFLCRMLVCLQNMPTNTATISRVNLAPVIFVSEKVSLFEILFSTTPKEESLVSFENSITPRQSLPKYIQHQRILI